MKNYLYFAYGSNLNREQMTRRCPESVGISTAALPGWALAERTYADIEPAPGEWVNGALYQISANDLAALDHFEGYPGYYTRIEVDVTDNRGVFRKAWVYTMTEEYKDFRNRRPFSGRYREICSTGAQEWGIPDAFAPEADTGYTLWQDKNIPDAARGIEEMLEFLKSSGPLPKAKHLWIGARVVITLKKQNIPGEFGFYPAPLEVTTSHARQLSWVFNDLSRLFRKKLNSMNKFCFYGSLAECAGEALLANPEISAREICYRTVLKAKESCGSLI